MPAAQMGRSNAEDAHQAIWRPIVTVAIRPGEAFAEGQLVERTGIGKTSVREALLRLKVENLIIGQPRAGYRAALVTRKEIREPIQLSDVGSSAELPDAKAGHYRQHRTVRCTRPSFTSLAVPRRGVRPTQGRPGGA